MENGTRGSSTRRTASWRDDAGARRGRAGYATQQQRTPRAVTRGNQRGVGGGGGGSRADTAVEEGRNGVDGKSCAKVPVQP